MKIYLAGFKTIEKTYNKPTDDIYLLSSFWEHKNGKYGEYVTQEKHILDSGAFTAINDKTGKYKNLDCDYYTIDYAELEDGSWRIIEAGDGEVSGLAENQDYEQYYRALCQLVPSNKI